MKRIHILLTSVGRRVELVQSFKRAALQMGVPMTIIGADISDTAPALAYCDQKFIVPRISSEEYIPTLLNVCKEYQVDMLIPTIDTDLLLLSMQKERFAQVGTTVLISHTDKIRICRDKRTTSSYFCSLGLNAPRTVSDIEQYSDGFPAFIKPADGSSSIGANRADSMEELRAYAGQLDHYVVQPFVTGTEYTVDVFCDLNGEPIYITPRVRVAVRGGEVLKTQIHHQQRIIEEIHTLIRDFKPCGPMTVQLIRDEEKDINQYIEINPRFGGGAPLSIKAGADSSEALLRLLLGEKLTYCPCAAAEGAVYSRFDQSVMIAPGNSPKVRAVIFDLDDTLYPETEYVRSGYRQVARCVPQIEHCEEKLWAAFRAKKPAIDTVLAEHGIFDQQVKDRCLRAYREQKPQIRLYDGVKELLEQLRRRGVKIGIITDGRPEGQRNKLEALGLYSLVDDVLITDELGSERFRKPNDIAFRIMQTRFNVPYGQMVYVGDNPEKDFCAPGLLGMQTVYFKNNEGLYSHKELRDMTVADTISQLGEIINRMTV